MSTMWLVCCCLCMLSVLIVCRAVPINREFSSNERAIYVDRSNENFGNESVCVSDDVLYKEGDSLPTADVCESCICKPPKFSCETIKCEVLAGCKAVHRSNQCCPIYQCECERDGKTYQNGQRLDTADSPCQACFCRSGEIVCTLIECYKRDDCEPRYVNGTCCPKYDHCPPLEPTPMTLYTSSPSPLEHSHPSSEYEDEVDIAPNNSENSLQDNSVDSSKRIDILGEIMSDSPYSASNSLNKHEEETSLKSVNTDSKSEILEETMSEIYTERTDATTEETEHTETEKSSENVKTEEYVDDTTPSSKMQADFPSIEKSTDDEEGSKTDIYEEKESFQGEESEEMMTEKSIKTTTVESISSEETTTHNDENEEMLAEGKPSWYIGDVKKVGEPFKKTTIDSTSESTEDEQDERKMATDDVTKESTTSEPPASLENQSFEHETERNPSKSDQISDYESNSEETLKTETISTTTPKEYDIPVLTLKSEMSTENMSIVIPKDLIRSTSYEEEISLLHDEMAPEVIGEKHEDSEASDTELTETFTNPTTLETHTTNDKNTDSDETESGDVSRTTLKIPEVEFKSHERTDSTETESNTEITTEMENSEVLSTTPNVLEGEHPDNERSNSAESESNEETTTAIWSNELSTTPNVLEGEHPNDDDDDDDDRSVSADTERSTQITSTADSVEFSTTPNVLEGEHPDTERSGSTDTETSTESTATTTINEETSSLTPDVLEGEHYSRVGGFMLRESITEASSDVSSDVSSTTMNVLEGEHPNVENSDIEENYSSTSTSITENENGEISTTANEVEIESDENRSATESTDMTHSESTTMNVLEGEHPDNGKSDSSENESSTPTTPETDTNEDTSEEKGRTESKEISDVTESTTDSTIETTEHMTGNGESLEYMNANSASLISDSQEPSENTTPNDNKSTYSSVESSTLEVSAESEEDNSAKILSLALTKNRTSLETPETGNSSESSDKSESLPEKWLKSEEESTTAKVNYERNSEEDTTTETTESVPSTSASTYNNKYVEFIDYSHISKEDSYPSSEVEEISNKHNKEDMKLNPEYESSTPTASSSNSEETDASTGSYIYPDMSIDKSSKTGDSSVQFVSDYEIYESKEKVFSTAEIYDYGSFYGSSKMKISEETSTTESSTHYTDSLYSNEEQSTEYVESHSTETPSVDSIPSESRDGSNKETEEVYSKEYVDSASRETTTVINNITESTTSNKNETETTTPRSEDSYYNEDETNASEIKSHFAVEDSNSQYTETQETPAKVVHDFSSKLHLGDYTEDSDSVIE